MAIHRATIHYSLLFVLGATSSCSTPQQSEPKPIPGKTHLSTDSVITRLAVSQYMSLSYSECTTMTRAFSDRFRLKGGTGAAIGMPEQEVLWSDVQGLLGAGTNRGVIFHYGLDAGRFVVGLSKVDLTPVPMTTGEFTYHWDRSRIRQVSNGRLDATEIPHNQWLERYVTAPLPATGRYFGLAGSVEARIGPGPDYDKLVYGYHPDQDMMPYEMEIARLYDQNQPPAGWDAFLVISCAAEQMVPGGDYFHKLCLHIRHKKRTAPFTVTDRLTNDPKDDQYPFRNRGANLGNLCPPMSNCGRYVAQPARILKYLEQTYQDSTATH